MRRILTLSLALAVLSSGVARAEDVVVDVRTPQGKPVVDAVVTAPVASHGPIRFPWTYRMSQHHMQFDPFVLVVPVGATVAFPNLDNVRHQVYSFSPAHPFELKLYGRDETRTVRFDKPGVIALGCNIHDSMVAFVVVVDTPYAAKTDAQGRAVIHNAPAGLGRVQVWHPYLRAPQHALGVPLAAGRDGVLHASVTAALGPPPDPNRAY
jgi:plastocyanin